MAKKSYRKRGGGSATGTQSGGPPEQPVQQAQPGGPAEQPVVAQPVQPVVSQPENRTLNRVLLANGARVEPADGE